MKTHVILLAALIVVSMLPTGLYAQETDPVGVCYGPSFKAWLAEGTVDTEIWAEDAVQTTVVGDMVTVYNGREDIRAHLDELRADDGFAMEITVVGVEGNTVTAESRVWDSDTRALGVAPLVANEVCTVEDGRAKSITWTMSEESLVALGAALAALPQTGREAYPICASVLVVSGVALVAGFGFKALRRRAWR